MRKTEMASAGSEISRKQRLRWTSELRARFEKAVNQLGGAERATPKGIMKIMGIPGLTIYHIKSHLQKYRITKYVPEFVDRGCQEKKKNSEIEPNFSSTSAAQLAKVLKMHREMQKRYHDENERQQLLKLKIEAQRSFLEQITENQKLPSLCEESDSSTRDYGSDSDISIPITLNSKNPTNRSTWQPWESAKGTVERAPGS